LPQGDLAFVSPAAGRRQGRERLPDRLLLPSRPHLRLIGRRTRTPAVGAGTAAPGVTQDDPLVPRLPAPLPGALRASRGLHASVVSSDRPAHASRSPGAPRDRARARRTFFTRRRSTPRRLHGRRPQRFRSASSLHQDAQTGSHRALSRAQTTRTRAASDWFRDRRIRPLCHLSSAGKGYPHARGGAGWSRLNPDWRAMPPRPACASGSESCCGSRAVGAGPSGGT
jgi:hypothetical protein